MWNNDHNVLLISSVRKPFASPRGTEYTHIISIGMNDISNAAEAMQRAALGQYLGEAIPGFTYTDPVAVDDMNFVTMMEVRRGSTLSCDTAVEE